MAKPDYDIAGLEASIEHSRKNIQTYKQAISDQQTQIADYRRMIETLERKKMLTEGVVLDASAGD